MGKVFEVDYRREYGVHSFTAVDGTLVTAVSHQSWDDFYRSFCALEPQSGYILSPELITYNAPLNLVKAMQLGIEERAETIRRASVLNSEATILLGSPTWESRVVRNSLVVIRDRNIEGYFDKRSVWARGQEKDVFSPEYRTKPLLQQPSHSAMICYDLIQAKSYGSRDSGKDSWIAPDVETLMVSACWATPSSLPDCAITGSGDERFRKPLEETVSGVFRYYPNLQEIIMADRAPGGMRSQPFNAHFRRAK